MGNCPRTKAVSFRACGDTWEKCKVSFKFSKLMCNKPKMTSTIEQESSQSLQKLIFTLHPPGYLCIKYPEKMQSYLQSIAVQLQRALQLVQASFVVQYYTKQLHIQHGDNKGTKERRAPVLQRNRRKVTHFTANYQWLQQPRAKDIP